MRYLIYLGFVIVPVVLFQQLVMPELNQLANFYEHVDNYAAQAADINGTKK